MKLRSITCFAEIAPPTLDEDVRAAGSFLRMARERYESSGYEVQTVRLALPSFASRMPAERVVDFARALEAACQANGVDYVTLGPAGLDDAPAYGERIVDVLATTKRVFAAAHVATAADGVDLGAARRVAEVIARNAALSEDGFANLRFAALARVGPGVPFLPAAYHAGGAPRFALATEAADLAVTSLGGVSSLQEAHDGLVHAIESHAARLASIARELGRPPRGVGLANVPPWPRFAGIDFSLAPFPVETTSIGVALEAMGAAPLGTHGSLTAAALLTQCLDDARFERAGFCGLFLPLLEDPRLAERGGETTLAVEDLLLYSAVCGTGLDTVPLPGDISPEEIEAILLDVAALALRLGKPLTARLMPMPGRRAGDALTFDFPYFAPGRVLSHHARPLRGLLAGSERLRLVNRRSGT